MLALESSLYVLCRLELTGLNWFNDCLINLSATKKFYLCRASFKQAKAHFFFFVKNIYHKNFFLVSGPHSPLSFCFKNNLYCPVHVAKSWVILFWSVWTRRPGPVVQNCTDTTIGVKDWWEMLLYVRRFTRLTSQPRLDEMSNDEFKS